jgi:hypothetical protein
LEDTTNHGLSGKEEKEANKPKEEKSKSTQKEKTYRQMKNT